MSIKSFAAAYQPLYLHLAQLAQQLKDGAATTPNYIVQGQQLLQDWQTDLAMVQGESLSTGAFGLWRSLHTELHRELRLLNMDLSFLGSSRTPATKAAKTKAVGDRLTKLLQYCEQIQTIIAADDPHKPEA